jgi:hypothetical protein
MKREAVRIRWHRPEARQALSMLRAHEFAAAPPTAETLARNMLLTVGIPVIEGAATAKEYATGLLQVAAEVEQALMVQYLYAATSVVTPQPRGRLVRIAKEEMAHLATVQNLLLLVGGRDAFHMQRDQLRKQGDQNPIPFVLRPVSRLALATYVAAEMPVHVPDDIRQKVDELVALAASSTTIPLHRVGAIYAVLRWIFLPAAEAGRWIDLPALAPMPADPHLTDADLTPGDIIDKFMAERGEWQIGLSGLILEMPRNTADAVHAIDRVSEQGEGFGGATDTHFEFFLKLAGDFDAGTIETRPLATSPSLGTGTGGESGELITHPYSKLWGEVFSRQYGLLVLTIYHGLRTPRDSAGELRGGLVDLAFASMRTIIETVSDHLATLPLRAGDAGAVGKPDVPAGPPYDLDPTLLLPPTSEAEISARHLNELSRLAAAYAQIEQAAEFANYPDHANTLADLRGHDQARRELIAGTGSDIV